MGRCAVAEAEQCGARLAGCTSRVPAQHNCSSVKGPRDKHIKRDLQTPSIRLHSAPPYYLRFRTLACHANAVLNILLPWRLRLSRLRVSPADSHSRWVKATLLPHCPLAPVPSRHLNLPISHLRKLWEGHDSCGRCEPSTKAASWWPKYA